MPTSLLSHLRAVVERPEERLSLASVRGDGAIDRALSGGLLKGAVVELSAPAGRAHITSIAITACVAAQEEAARFGSYALCAWIDPANEIFGPGLSARGIDLARFFVARPSLDRLPRTAVRVAESRAFAVVVIDATSLDSLDRLPTVVRRLALAVEGTSCAVLLLTDLGARRSVPLPTGARIEVSRTQPGAIAMRVAKDRHGRIGMATSVPWD